MKEKSRQRIDIFLSVMNFNKKHKKVCNHSTKYLEGEESI